MDVYRAINIAVGCVLASPLENKEKREVIETEKEWEEAKKRGYFFW